MKSIFYIALRIENPEGGKEEAPYEWKLLSPRLLFRAEVFISGEDKASHTVIN